MFTSEIHRRTTHHQHKNPVSQDLSEGLLRELMHTQPSFSSDSKLGSRLIQFAICWIWRKMPDSKKIISVLTHLTTSRFKNVCPFGLEAVGFFSGGWTINLLSSTTSPDYRDLSKGSIGLRKMCTERFSLKASQS